MWLMTSAEMAFACLQEVRAQALRRDPPRPHIDSVTDRPQQVSRLRNRLLRADCNPCLRQSNDCVRHACNYHHRLASGLLVSVLLRVLWTATRDLLLQAANVSHEASSRRQDQNAAAEADGLRWCFVVRVGMYMLLARDQLGRTTVCVVQCPGRFHYPDRSRFARRSGVVGIVRQS